MQGKFITLEGCEGVGKSTQLRLLTEYLDATGQEYVLTREPGGTELAESIRSLILTKQMDSESEALLFAAARCDHIDNVIRPALDSGKLVICDRYVHSSLAYQAYGREMGYDRVKEINRYAFEHCMPDAVVFIDMNPLDSWRKRKGKVVLNDRMEQEKDEFHLKVYKGFLKIADDSFVTIVPDENKAVTSKKIIDALQSRGLIK